MLTGVPRTIEWLGGLDGHVEMVDQTLLPAELKIVQIRDVAEMWDAIKQLKVRGAPAIGIAAGMGVVLATAGYHGDEAGLVAEIDRAGDYLISCRPTAVNLPWAVARMKRAAERRKGRGVAEIKDALLAEANAIRDQDAEMCHAIGHHGKDLIGDGQGVLTHCNAGSLATAEYGTALAVIYAAHEAGKRPHVYVDETRPLLQGARLTAWELGRAGVDATIICDNMAAQVMKEGRIDLVITGADRIAGNGDAANKIGTYGVAVLAKAHQIPFYVAAPSSTFDLSIPNGDAIPIEQRDPREVSFGFGRATAPEDSTIYNPAFDVTPAEMIAGIVTERGIIAHLDTKSIGIFFSEGA